MRRTREAAAVLEAAVPSIELPLATAAAVSELDGQPDAAAFERSLGPLVGADGPFVSAALWRPGDAAPAAVLGEQSGLATIPKTDRDLFLNSAVVAGGLNVFDLLPNDPARLGYGYTPPGLGAAFVVYAEQALPSDRTAVPQADSAFKGMDYALYLGTGQSDEELLVASTADLPLKGRTAEVSVEFGDTQLLLVESPTEELGGGLLAALPWLVLASGAVLTIGGAGLVDRLQRRREEAERLASDNARLHQERLAASAELQRSLLPDHLPEIAGFETAAVYTPGVAGTEVGGDWYDVVAAEGHVVAVVGDVSGRGLPAAAIMASLRYGMRIPAANGDSPDAILTAVDRIGLASRHGHFATVLCTAVDRRARRLTVCNAGHPPPLLLSGGSASWVETLVQPPLGVVADGTRYASEVVDLPAAGTLVFMTDGLFERRGEPVDVGRNRVLDFVSTLGDLPVEDLVQRIVGHFGAATSADDTAVLALRWRP